MLKIVDTTECHSERLDFNYYTFGADWNRREGDYIYWRSGDIKWSFIEVGIDFQHGYIFTMNLVLVVDVVKWPLRCPPIHKMDIPIQRGIPICDTGRWPEEWKHREAFLDDPGPLRARLGKRRMAIEFADREQVASTITAERVSFGIDQGGYLCLMEVENITRKEMSLLKTALLKK